MGISPSGAAEAPLTVYGSWVTEVPPQSCPENISPDNQEIAYLPGEVGSRPALQKIPGITFPAVNGVLPTAVAGKSFTMPNGDIKNLYFDSAGRLWVEDFTNYPNAITLLLQSTPGSFYRSTTFQGREYIAISDGLHGADIPLQWDGTNLDRFTQDGPGAPPTVASVGLPAVDMASSGNTLTRQNNLVTCQTAAPHGLQVGYQAQIANVPDSNATTVNQSNVSPTPYGQTADGSYWGYNSNEWRTLFNPGTSPLSALTAQGFGFNIPSNATILGVTASFYGIGSGSGTGTIAQVGLWYEGALLGTAKPPASPLSTVGTEFSYGSSGDEWGAALTPAIVNDPSFGFAISATTNSYRIFLYAPFQMTVYYTLSGSGTVAQISSIVIDNEVNPGLALVTTTEPHGLAPNESVSIVGVEPATVASVTTAEWSSGTTTLTTSTSHNLSPGSVIQVSDVTTSTTETTFSFNGTFTVQSVPSPDQVCYAQVPITATDPDVINATASTGSISIAWPIPDDTPTPTYFNVESCPTSTTFYVAVNYSDGTWSSGTVGFIWEGTFYVTEVPSTTSFVYQQYGPNGATTAVGTVTPFGQAAPGLHLCQVLFLDRQGGISEPSPPVTFIANGGQYVQVSNIPVGPSNIVARILAFTGAQPNVPGTLPPFYYIPVPAQTEGQIVSTATQINDNTTTSVTLDFSDNTLFSAIGISVPGNTLANQIVIDGALGFGDFQSSLTTWGQRNRINNLLNMSFAGGGSPESLGDMPPLGWSGADVLFAGSDYPGVRPPGWCAIFSSSGTISQSAYLDAYGDPIATGNTAYLVRTLLFSTTDGGQARSVTFAFTSASTGFSSSATFNYASSWSTPFWAEADFSETLPTTIPPDLLFSISVTTSDGQTIGVQEVSVIYQQFPFDDTLALASYPNNPEGIDGETGVFGAQDPNKLMDMGLVKDTLYLLTQAPSGRLHETNGGGLPSTWQVNEVADSCGALSAFGLTHSQADDGAGSGAIDWMAWPSEGGAFIFGGGLPEKVSQEIQPNWYDPSRSDTSIQINMAAATTAWGLNDPVQRLLMFGLPIGNATAPSQIYVLNYRNLGSAAAIAGSPPFHPSFAGKLIATDNSRKWTHWLRPMNGAARMYRSAGALTLCLFGGNGQSLGTAAGYGNAYTLNPAKFTDDDYGQIYPYYDTYFFLDPEKAQMLQLKGGRLLMAYILAYIQPPAGMAGSQSQVTLTYFADDLNNAWPLTTTRILTSPFYKDRNFGGGMAQGERIAVRIASSPVPGAASATDNGFVLSRFSAFLKNAKLSISGVNL